MFDDFPAVEAFLLEPGQEHAVRVMWDHVQPTVQGLQVWLKPPHGQKVIHLPPHWSSSPPDELELHFEHGLVLGFNPHFYQGPLPLEGVPCYLVFMLKSWCVQESFQNQATTKISGAQLLVLQEQRSKSGR